MTIANTTKVEVTKKVFISYSWTSINHENWVLNLAERLIDSGIEVKFDKWDLKEGHDKNDFMESMVRSDEIHKVLIIVDKQYSEKADMRSSGVGTETQIISPLIYEEVKQEKFIPLVTELNENGKPFLPVYLKSRIYIDFSESSHFEENFEKLIRNILDRPKLTKPKLGKIPSYLDEKPDSIYKSSNIIQKLDADTAKNSKRINTLLSEFFNVYFDELTKFVIDKETLDNNGDCGKTVYENILSYTPLRNNYIILMEKLVKSEADFDIDILIKFLERLPNLLDISNQPTNHIHCNNSNFKFIIHETFLYTIAISLKYEKYKLLQDIFYSSYFFTNRYNNSISPKHFDVFYNYLEVFNNYYKEAFSKNLLSPMADLLITRVPDNLNKIDLIDADLLIYYISTLKELKWFPMTYVYKEGNVFELFNRLQSKRHFEKVKFIFEVETIAELKEKLLIIRNDNINDRVISYPNSFNSVQPIFQAIDIDKIGTLR